MNTYFYIYIYISGELYYIDIKASEMAKIPTKNQKRKKIFYYT